MATVWLAEVAEALAEYGRLLCRPSVDREDGEVVLTLHIQLRSHLSDLELQERLRQLSDIAALRAIAARYDIPSEQFEAVLRRKEER